MNPDTICWVCKIPYIFHSVPNAVCDGICAGCNENYLVAANKFGVLEMYPKDMEYIKEFFRISNGVVCLSIFQRALEIYNSKLNTRRNPSLYIPSSSRCPDCEPPSHISLPKEDCRTESAPSHSCLERNSPSCSSSSLYSSSSSSFRGSSSPSASSSSNPFQIAPKVTSLQMTSALDTPSPRTPPVLHSIPISSKRDELRWDRIMSVGRNDGQNSRLTPKNMEELNMIVDQYRSAQIDRMIAAGFLGEDEPVEEEIIEEAAAVRKRKRKD